MSKKEIRLTNWQVPRDPRQARFDAYKNVPEIDMRRYEKVGGVEHHEDVASVAAKMIAKQEAARGTKIDQEAPKSTVNLNGINDDRERKTWSPGQPFDVEPGEDSEG